MEKIKIAWRDIEESGYDIRRSKHYTVISKDNETVLEVVELPDAILVMNENQTLCENECVEIKAKEGIIMAVGTSSPEVLSAGW